MSDTSRTPWSLAPLLLLVLVTAGCTNSPEPPLQPEQLTLTYTVEGPSYVAGFWPTYAEEHIEGDRLVVRVTEAQTVADAAGHPTEALNLTYTIGETSVTHWVEPGSGRIVAIETQGTEFGSVWRWEASGQAALLGRWPALREGTVPPVIERSCCPGDRVFSGPADRPMHLELVSAEGTGEIIPRLPQEASSWSPPGARQIQREAWNQRYPPAGTDTDLLFPLEDALTALAENDDGAASWLEQHPEWILVASSYVENPGLGEPVPEARWLLQLGSRSGSVVQYQVIEYEAADLVEVHDVTGGSELKLDAWQRNASLRLGTYPEAWRAVGSMIEASEVHWRNVESLPRVGGPIFAAGMTFDAQPQPAGPAIAQRAMLDLHTGLLASMTTPLDPLDLVHRPLTPG